ncbi:DNA gyrase subunit A [Shigella flexneri]
MIEKIAELVKEKRLEGISALRDESDKDGMRIVIEIKRDAVGEVVLNNLYLLDPDADHVRYQYGCPHQGQPKILNLKEIISAFVRHRREVVTRRTIYELRKARERAHILEGLAIALANIDRSSSLSAVHQRLRKQARFARAWKLVIRCSNAGRCRDDAARPEGLEGRLVSATVCII